MHHANASAVRSASAPKCPPSCQRRVTAVGESCWQSRACSARTQSPMRFMRWLRQCSSRSPRERWIGVVVVIC